MRNRDRLIKCSKTFLAASSILAAAAAVTPWSRPALAYTIEGKIEHVEQLPAVDNSLAPGARFNLGAELIPGNFWVQIPPWLAGAWQAREETATYREDYKSGKSSRERQTFKVEQDFTYGQQVDASGQIWHYLGVPYSSRSKRSQMTETHEVKEKSMVENTAQSVTFRSVATVVLVDDLISRIRKTYQQESLTSYHPSGKNALTMTASTKVFDAGGRPQTIQQNEAQIHRVGKFVVIDSKDGKDLKALFQAFMASRGEASQAPSELRREPTKPQIREPLRYSPTNQPKAPVEEQSNF